MIITMNMYMYMYMIVHREAQAGIKMSKIKDVFTNDCRCYSSSDVDVYGRSLNSNYMTVQPASA